MQALSELCHSLVARFTFCSQGEHKRETIEPWLGTLRIRCIDCGHVKQLGKVSVHATNKSVSI
jgi:hypothetical protein